MRVRQKRFFPGTAMVASLVILSAALLTGLLGALFERLVIKPFRYAPLLMVLVATVALGTVIRESLRIFYPQGSNPQIFPSLLPGGGGNPGEGSCETAPSPSACRAAGCPRHW